MFNSVSFQFQRCTFVNRTCQCTLVYFRWRWQSRGLYFFRIIPLLKILGKKTIKSTTKYQVFSSVILLFTQNVISPIREYNPKKIYLTSGENFIFKRRMWWFLKNLYTTEKNYIKVVVKTPAAKASAVADEVWTMQKTNGWKYYQVSIILVLGTFP